MVDITRDKPIKVTVRVIVPVRDHPKVREEVSDARPEATEWYVSNAPASQTQVSFSSSVQSKDEILRN
jgi:hypothetical protein